jgi:hypothetical protein
MIKRASQELVKRRAVGGFTLSPPRVCPHFPKSGTQPVINAIFVDGMMRRELNSQNLSQNLRLADPSFPAIGAQGQRALPTKRRK